ncbi:MAG: peptidoglycan-binding domain-containing protein [bacterium]|nr:peptidoglycan-binding domain-containing protein [bacterium]
MFKKICTAVIASFVFFNIAFAQTSTATEQDLLTIIKQLQTQIQLLQTQIADLQNQVQSVKTEFNFTRALAKGMSGDDVKRLQEFLKTFPDVYPEGLVTGYFGLLTEAAVKKFQEQNGIESVGTVGPKTQAKLIELAATGAGQSDSIP